MKKNLITNIAFFAVIMCALSCSNNESKSSCDTNMSTPKENDINIEFYNSKLITELQNVNNEFLTGTRSKPNWSREETAKVVIADLVGAWNGCVKGGKIGGWIGTHLGQPHTGAVVGSIVGGVICGATASWIQAPNHNSQQNKRAIPTDSTDFSNMTKIFSELTQNELSLDSTNIKMSLDIQKKVRIDNEILSTINLKEEQLNIGKLHNIMLSVLDGNTTLKTTGIAETKDTLFNAIINSDEMKSLYEEIKTYATTNAYISDGSKAEYTIKLFIDVFEKYSQSQLDIIEIINKYSEIINNSDELTEEDKEYIMAGLGTALYSMNYWEISNSK